MSQITTTVTKPVTIGTGAGDYASPLTITSAGTVDPSANGATGVYENGTTYSLSNSGNVDGGDSGAPSSAIDSGLGVNLVTGVATNESTGSITGGTGGDGYNGGGGAYQGGGTLTNYHDITGGTGGTGSTGGSMGTLTTEGGVGVRLTGGTLTNETTGTITGGNPGSAFSFGGAGVYQEGGTLNNDGSIKSGAVGAYAAVDLHAGMLTNESTGTIIGGSGGAGGAGESFGGNGASQYGGTFDNFNQITGGSGYSGGLGFSFHGGTFTNESTGSITGGAGNSVGGFGELGVYLLGAGTFTNDGSITGGAGHYAGYGATVRQGTLINGGHITGGIGGGGAGPAAGVRLVAGTLTNQSTGTITGGKSSSAVGGVGVNLSGGTVTNDGNIVGGDGSSAGGAGAYLNGGTLTTSGTVSGGLVGTARADAVEFGPNASTLTVDAGAKFNGAVGGFAIGDTVDITNLSPSQVATDFGVAATPEGGGTYAFNGSAGGETLTTSSDGTLNFTGNFSADHFVLSPDGTDITLAAGLVCFGRGTRIRTPTGDTAVEDLAVGDSVLTVSGEARPFRWLGSRRLDCTRHPNPAAIWPIRIQAGAFAPDQPTRDLWVSRGHSLAIEGVLIQAETLVNGSTIMQVPRARVEYWHVELGSHDILLAEGLPAESYLDVGNRTGFVNGGAYLEAYPDFTPRHASESCVPVVTDGAVVQQTKAALLARAEELGYVLTADADVHIVADGKRIDPVRLNDKRLAVMLPAAASAIELRCRSFIPAHINSESDDQRLLGICIARLQLDGIDVPLTDEAAFGLGWHALEADPQGQQWRWCTERAPLPAATRLVVIDICHEACCYWAEPQARSIALFG